ncbi:hypothetical protein CY34DRAFT_16064 [Suillus luteus UH-Slu-Lm8-n1]|uniref:Uncharacterized protein n=1 Tax=Suillus luteus UH-Slu-Lm8-n1 TaxID=930992 RepID=A0A0D0AFJ9_9AGAM|nr:hypothetical protein CY34DRAFT_16064 [Suillus luteus UH-Slu-Lm8-n1]
MKMKYLLCGLLSSYMNKAHSSSVKYVISKEDAYLLNPPIYEEDDTYVPMTLKLLIAPVRETMCAMVIKDKNPKVRVKDIMGWLQISHHYWKHISLQAVEQAMQLIILD